MADSGGVGAWPPRGRTADALVAALVFVLVAGVVLLSLEGGVTPQNPWLGWPLIVLASGVLFFRRTRPLLTALVTLGCNVVYYPAASPDGIIIITFLVALYTVAAETGLLAASVLAGLPILAVVIVEARTHFAHLDDVAVFMLAGWLTAIVAVGGVVNNRRAYLIEAEERARAADRVREEESRLRASEERLRIARELHDVIGHNISLINVQAAAALHRLPADPAQAGDALAAIRDAGKETLRELRATLGVLRQVDEDAPVAPAPGLGRLPDLVTHSRAAGLDVAVETSGAAVPLPADVDLAAYRIVQEALTNVARHSGETRADVSVAYGRTDVVIEVSDAGTGPSRSATAGHGVTGMGERARAVGGELSAGPREPRGYLVRARLPLGGTGSDGEGER